MCFIGSIDPLISVSDFTSWSSIDDQEDPIVSRSDLISLSVAAPVSSNRFLVGFHSRISLRNSSSLPPSATIDCARTRNKKKSVKPSQKIVAAIWQTCAEIVGFFFFFFCKAPLYSQIAACPFPNPMRSSPVLAPAPGRGSRVSQGPEASEPDRGRKPTWLKRGSGRRKTF